MTLIAFGINHKTASVAVREKVAFSVDQKHSALQDMISITSLSEAALLSTCNRMEMYLDLDGSDIAPILDWLCTHKSLEQTELQQCHYVHIGEDAIVHMMKVASGLDSMVLGEPQILGQLKEAFSIARTAGTIGSQLDRLFQQSFSVAKLVRTETKIGSSAVSVAYAAVTQANRLFSSLENTTALFIGAGNTIELAAQHFTKQATMNTIFANRTRERASRLAEQHQGKAIALSEIPEYLSSVDIVITSTASPLPILGKGLIEKVIKQRKHKPIFMIDLAVPRDIEAEVGDLPDVYLYDIDSLQNVINKNLAERQKAAVEAEVIIHKHSKRFMEWRRSLAAVSTIRSFRDKYQQLADSELKRSISKLNQGDKAEDVLAELSRRLTNKFLHEPTRQINEAGSQGDDESVSKARTLFSLDKKSGIQSDN